MAEGIIYGPVLGKLISGLTQKDQAVLFEMEDGSLKVLNEIEDFHKVKTALEHNIIEAKILKELFGGNSTSRKVLKPTHFENFMALFKVILDHTAPSTIRSVAAKFNLLIDAKDGSNRKISSEKLRE